MLGGSEIKVIAAFSLYPAVKFNKWGCLWPPWPWPMSPRRPSCENLSALFLIHDESMGRPYQKSAEYCLSTRALRRGNIAGELWVKYQTVFAFAFDAVIICQPVWAVASKSPHA